MTAEIPPEEAERLARELADAMRDLRVEDVLMNTLLTVSQLGYRRLGLTEETGGDRDLDQARLAIETMQALTPVLEGFVPGELVRDFKSSVANLQLAYAEAARAPASDVSGGQSPGHGSEGQAGEGEAPERGPTTDASDEDEAEPT